MSYVSIVSTLSLPPQQFGWEGIFIVVMSVCECVSQFFINICAVGFFLLAQTTFFCLSGVFEYILWIWPRIVNCSRNCCFHVFSMVGMDDVLSVIKKAHTHNHAFITVMSSLWLQTKTTTKSSHQPKERERERCREWTSKREKEIENESEWYQWIKAGSAASEWTNKREQQTTNEQTKKS